MVAAYKVGLRGLEELGTGYRVKRNGKHITDDSGQNVLLAKMFADKGDHAAAAAEVIKVLRGRIGIYPCVFEGAVE